MNTERIDFISSYCDRWCERCAYTARCSAFTAAAAIAMCGSVEEGFELADGEPRPADRDAASAPPPDWLPDLEDTRAMDAAVVELDRLERGRRLRVGATPMMQLARGYSGAGHAWLTTHRAALGAGSDEVLKEALAIVGHDLFFVTVKLDRALRGRDGWEQGETWEDHPVQNDWNGSAKVALISLERSEHAWRAIAQATGDTRAAALADRLHQLRNEVDDAFPTARLFVRPGFDEPRR